MFNNLTEKEKENKFQELIAFAGKIKNIALKRVCINILEDYKDKLWRRPAGHDGIENIKNNRTHQCFNGGLLDHMLNVTQNAYKIGLTYENKIDMDLVLIGAILHDIGKTKIFEEWKEENEVRANLNYVYLLVDHVYLGETIVEKYLEQEDISEKLKYQVLHIIATHMDTHPKHMAEAYIVSYADSIDADVENMISYPRNAINPITKTFVYESENRKDGRNGNDEGTSTKEN